MEIPLVSVVLFSAIQKSAKLLSSFERVVR